MQTQTTTGYKQVNGINMYYEIHGDGTGVPLVLIHGGGSTIYTTFGRVLPQFAKNRKVIAVELQAHGHTSDRDAPETFEQDADDVAELLNQLGVEKADLLGFSNGGSTALQVTIRHPQVVNKLVAASAFFKREGMQPWFFGFMETATIDYMPQPLKDAFLAINPSQDALQNMHDKDANRMRTFVDWPDEYLTGIQTPTLLIFGDQDVMTTTHAAEMHRLIPNSRLLILPSNHGRYIGEIMDEPDDVLSGITVHLVEQFLNG